MTNPGQMSIYLPEEDREILKELVERTGLSKSALIRIALQRAYHGDGKDRRARLIEIAEEIKGLA